MLEIGSFLGPVSISLKKIGYSVSALDIPEFYNSSRLRDLYERNDIPFCGLNLRKFKLPYESNSFDVVVICEVIEHLNFNPLPVFNEINRVLKDSGYIYIGMPNQAHVINRIKLLLGKSIHNSVEELFNQLDRNLNMVVGLHWKEYTLDETLKVIEKMGFETAMKYYFKQEGHTKRGIFKKILKEALYCYPPFRPFQVVVGRKVSTPAYDFWLTDANS